MGFLDFLDPRNLLPPMPGGGGSGGSGNPLEGIFGSGNEGGTANVTVEPTATTGNQNAELEANPMDVQKAYGFGTGALGGSGNGGVQFNAMRRKQMGMGGS